MIKKPVSILFVLTFILFSFTSFAQNDIEFIKSNFTQDTEAFKEAIKNLKKGNEEFENENYREANVYFKEANDFNPDNSMLNYRIGYSCLFSGSYSESIPYFEKARKLNPDVSSDINFLLGQAYHLSGEFEKAVIEYKNDNKLLSEENLQEEIDKNNKYIDQCEYGIKLKNESRDLIVIPYDSTINTEFYEYGFFLIEKDSLAVYTRIGERVISDNKGDETIVDEQIIFLKKKDAAWEKFYPEKFNTRFDDGIAGVSHDGKILFVYKGKGGKGNIYTSERNGFEFTDFKMMNEMINSKDNENSVSLSEDGKTIYFVSDREDNNLGKTDIYYSELDDNGEWGQAVNIGPNINTPEAEECVFISNDGNTLYFSSKGHQTIGGFDIFKSEKINGSWSKAENLGIPLNSPDDDMYYAHYDTIAFFTSVREGNKGKTDIFFVNYVPEEIITDTTVTDSLITVIVDENTDEPASPENINEYMIIKDIHFELDKYTNNNALSDLDKLADFLIKDPGIILQIKGYTDTQGKDSYNLSLSEKRAGFVYNYLVSKGVPDNQLVKQGLGEKDQISKNKYPDGKYNYKSLGYNRRVEFDVRQGKEPHIIFQRIYVPESLRINQYDYLYSIFIAAENGGNDFEELKEELPELRSENFKNSVIYIYGNYFELEKAEAQLKVIKEKGFKDSYIFYIHE